jgi:ethanolaminephosphotransferase
LIEYPKFLSTFLTSVLTSLSWFSVLLVWLSIFSHACALVIRDITEFLGIACFTVCKKDGEGVWKETRDIKQDGCVKRL